MKSSAVISGSFAPTVQLEKLEIPTVFRRFSSFHSRQNLSLLTLADFIIGYFLMPATGIAIHSIGSIIANPTKSRNLFSAISVKKAYQFPVYFFPFLCYTMVVAVRIGLFRQHLKETKRQCPGIRQAAVFAAPRRNCAVLSRKHCRRFFRAKAVQGRKLRRSAACLCCPFLGVRPETAQKGAFYWLKN